MYEGKVIAGPMVRISHLGFRLLCAHHGADILFTEEIIGYKLARTKREVNPVKGVIEYVHFEHHGKPIHRKVKRSVVFSTRIGGEGKPVVLQIGAPNPEVAARALQAVDKTDVQGFDLNMGCPKAFSVKQGMGAVLMSTPDLACSILEAMVANAGGLPVSVKTRLMDTDDDAVELLRRLGSTGVHAISLHARTRDQRSSLPALYHRFQIVRERLGKDFKPSLVLNGDVSGRAEALDLMVRTGCQGVMICRACMNNPSVFNADVSQRHGDVLVALSECLRWHLRYGSSLSSVKYHLTRAIQDCHSNPALNEVYASLQAATTMERICLAMGFTKKEWAALLQEWDDPLQIVDAPEGFKYPSDRVQREEDVGP